jgi:hypothetical protein
MNALSILDTRVLVLSVDTLIGGWEYNGEEAFIAVSDHDGRYLGMVNVDVLVAEKEVRLEKIRTSILPLTAIREDRHLYEILRYYSESESDILPVIDKDQRCLGVITRRSLLHAMNQMLSVQHEGAVVVLSVVPGRYLLSDIIRVIESSNAAVLGIQSVYSAASSEIFLHIKINTGIIRSVLSGLERFNYKIDSYYMRKDNHDDLDMRYKNLMSYLDI